MIEPQSRGHHENLQPGRAKDPDRDGCVQCIDRDRRALLQRKSFAKALDLLCCFTMERPEWGVTDLANYLGLHKSAVHRRSATFLRLRFVEQPRRGATPSGSVPRNWATCSSRN